MEEIHFIWAIFSYLSLSVFFYSLSLIYIYVSYSHFSTLALAYWPLSLALFFPLFIHLLVSFIYCGYSIYFHSIYKLSFRNTFSIYSNIDKSFIFILSFFRTTKHYNYTKKTKWNRKSRKKEIKKGHFFSLLDFLL